MKFTSLLFTFISLFATASARDCTIDTRTASPTASPASSPTVSPATLIITSGGTATSISENSGANQAVYTTTVANAGSSSIDYALASGHSSDIEIDVDTGVVTLIIDPDYEAHNEYMFTVIATDVGAQVTTTQAVSLTIIDEDETSADGDNSMPGP